MNDKHASDNRPANPGIPPFPAGNDSGLPLPSWVQAFLEHEGSADLLAKAGLEEAALAAPAAPDASEDEFGDEESVWLTPPLDDYSELLAELDRLAAEGETAEETVAAFEEEVAPVVQELSAAVTIAQPEAELLGGSVESESAPETIQAQEPAPVPVVTIAQPEAELLLGGTVESESAPETIQAQEPAPVPVVTITQPEAELLGSTVESESAPETATPISTEPPADSPPEATVASALEPLCEASQADDDTLEEFEFDHSMLSLDDEEMEGEFDHWMLPLDDEDTVTLAEAEDHDVAPPPPGLAEAEVPVAVEAEAAEEAQPEVAEPESLIAIEAEPAEEAQPEVAEPESLIAIEAEPAEEAQPEVAEPESLIAIEAEPAEEAQLEVAEPESLIAIEAEPAEEAQPEVAEPESLIAVEAEPAEEAQLEVAEPESLIAIEAEPAEEAQPEVAEPESLIAVEAEPAESAQPEVAEPESLVAIEALPEFAEPEFLIAAESDSESVAEQTDVEFLDAVEPEFLIAAQAQVVEQTGVALPVVDEPESLIAVEALPAFAEPEFPIAAEPDSESVAEQTDVEFLDAVEPEFLIAAQAQVAEQTAVALPDVAESGLLIAAEAEPAVLAEQTEAPPDSEAASQETDPVLIAARALLARVLAGDAWDTPPSGEVMAHASTEANPTPAEPPSDSRMTGETEHESLPDEPAEAAASPASLAETIGGIEQEMADTAVPAVPETAGRTDHLLAFQLGSGTYAVDVHEIVRLDAVPKTTPVPHVPDYIHGVTNLRGEIIALVDMRTLLSLDAIQDSNQERMLVVQTGRQRLLVGLIVDGVKGMAAVSSDTVRPPSGAVSDKVAPFLRGVCQHEGHFMTVLDLDRLMDSQEMRGFWAN